MEYKCTLGGGPCDGYRDCKHCGWATHVIQERKLMIAMGILFKNDQGLTYLPVPAEPSRKGHRKVSELTHDGKTLTVPEWAELSGISEKTIRDRLDSGWSVERALTTPPRPGGPTLYDAVWEGRVHTMSLSEWGTLSGINPRTIKGRLNKGWSMTKAITTPVDERLSRRFSKR